LAGELSALRRGDTKAFEAFVMEHERQVFAHLSRVLGFGDDVPDLAQEVFIRAWRGLPSFRGDSTLSTWLYRITHHVALSEISRRKRRPQHVEIDELEHASKNDPGPDATDMSRDVRRYLDRLSGEQCAALTLFYLQDLPVAEIAVVMSVPENTVKTHLSRGRKALGKLLTEAGFGP
jgi:RNA polymerase sigma-70 factor (ECF subfamily)